jgi:hypothetical protein
MILLAANHKWERWNMILAYWLASYLTNWLTVLVTEEIMCFYGAQGAVALLVKDHNWIQSRGISVQSGPVSILLLWDHIFPFTIRSPKYHLLLWFAGQAFTPMFYLWICATCLVHPINHDATTNIITFRVQIIKFIILQLLPFSYTQIFSSTLCSQTHKIQHSVHLWKRFIHVAGRAWTS